MRSPKEPSVDAVVLSWNRTRDTLECIESLLAQKGVAVNVYVVEQGSRASTVEALRRLAREGRIVLRELGRNMGVPAGRNIGMSMGSAECIVSIDNDAVLADPDALRRVAKRFERDPILGAIGFRIDDDGSGGGDRSSWCYPRSMLSSRFQEFEASRFVGAGHAIRRSALARTKGYDEALFFYWEELDLSYQLIEAGYRIVYDPSVIVRHKSSPEARLWWERGRFYYRARNRIYLTHKHFRRPILTVGVAMGYMALALRNRTLDQWAAGVTGALSMIRRAGWRSRPGLSREARRRIQGCAGPRAASFLNQFRTRLVSRPAPGR